jgi:GeoRSP system SPASM domain protein
MNLKELTWPVRLYWDLPPVASCSLDDLKICEDIIEAKILYLSLSDSSSSLGTAGLAIVDKLKDKNIAVSLTIESSALDRSILARLSDKRIKTVFVRASSLAEVRSATMKIKEYGTRALSLGISFDVGKENFRVIPEVVSFCLNNGISDLVFPIQRLEVGLDYFYINQKERDELRLSLDSIDFGKIKFTIHDPFLWKVFYPDIDYHEGGCQAANSMLFISPEYKVYPCPAFPFELGDLHETLLREIILSGGKKEFRNSLLISPGGCLSCVQGAKCLGGCRGRAFVFSGSPDHPDPACK